jgi:hypothetical protein
MLKVLVAEENHGYQHGHRQQKAYAATTAGILRLKVRIISFRQRTPFPSGRLPGKPLEETRMHGDERSPCVCNPLELGKEGRWTLEGRSETRPRSYHARRHGNQPVSAVQDWSNPG